MKLTRFLMTAAAAAVAAQVLTGCSALAVGEEEFACTGMPGSVYCHSARDVYEKTNDGVVPSPVGKRDGSYNEDCDDCVRSEDVNPELAVDEDENSRYAVGAKRSASSTESVEVYDRSTGETKTIRRKTLEMTNDEVINNYVAPHLPTEPVPVRTPSQVMRIWIAPYVDTNGDLVAPGYVYTEIEPRRWIYPGSESWGTGKMFAPLQAVTPYARSQAPKEPAYNSLEKLKREQAKHQ
ncbi:type IV conjugative transfer system lipoprotein TraV [Sutterella sp.]|uniref:type IV conjugative transfer system lipoprotein TraV n=1 Tax=Sutterella sp. TaxID=1981025 RepID=UPI003FD8A468